MAINGPFWPWRGMSVFEVKVDVNHPSARCPLMTQSGHEGLAVLQHGGGGKPSEPVVSKYLELSPIGD